MITKAQRQYLRLSDQDRYLACRRGKDANVGLLPRECHGTIRKVFSKESGSWAVSGTRLGGVNGPL